MALKMNFMRREEDSVVICALVGSLDTETHEEFKNKIKKHLVPSCGGMVLNLRELEYISSLGISAILQLERDTQAQHISLSVVEVPAHIRQVFKIVNALPNMRIFASMQEADNYLMEIQNKIKEGR